MSLRRLSEAVDGLNERIGRVVCWGIMIVMVLQVAQVILRKVFNNPQIWVWDINGQLTIAFSMLAGGYVLLHDSHVRMDLVYARLSPRKRIVVELITFPVFLFLFILVVWKGGEMAWHSWKILEKGRNLMWKPPIYPVKTTLFVGGVLLLLQGLSRFIKSLAELRGSGRPGKA